jgi:hypothetical protein
MVSMAVDLAAPMIQVGGRGGYCEAGQRWQPVSDLGTWQQRGKALTRDPGPPHPRPPQKAVMGMPLAPSMNQPYLSTTIHEFWSQR